MRFYILLIFAFASQLSIAQRTCPVANLWQNGNFESSNLVCLKLNPLNALANASSPFFGNSVFRWQATTALQPGVADEPVADKNPGSSSGYYLYIDPRTKTGWNYEFWQDIPVEKNTNYTFSLWYVSMNVSSDNPSTIRLAINGTAITSSVTVANSSKTWVQISGTWNSGPATSAKAGLQTLDANILGHNIGVDDISFGSGKLIVNAGRDTIYCVNSQIYLGTNRVGQYGVSCDNTYTYDWQPAANILGNNKISSPKLKNPIIPGTYIVTITDYNGNSCKDSMQIYTSSPSLVHRDIFKDTAVCPPVLFNVNFPANYLLTKWDNGSVLNQRSINSLGKYTVLFTDLSKCVNLTDTFDVTVKNPVSPFDLKDTTVCPGKPVFRSLAGILKPGQRAMWYDLDTSHSKTISNIGTYWVQIFGPCDSYLDSFKIKPTADAVLGLTDQIFLCENTDTVLNIPYRFSPLLWWDGDTSHVKRIDSAGKFILQYNGGCNWLNEPFWVNTSSSTLFSLGPDDSVCFSAPRRISAPANHRYKWSTGATTPYIDISSEGLYWVQITNSRGCISTDSIRFTPIGGSQNIYVPNAFTPDGNGRNEWFPHSKLPYIASLKIYNRWGQCVYKNEEYPAWDGTYKNQPAPEGIYVYILEYKDCSNNRIVQKGNFQLLR